MFLFEKAFFFALLFSIVLYEYKYFVTKGGHITISYSRDVAYALLTT